MRSVDYADRARQWFRRAWAEPEPRLPADRARLVGSVAQLLRARARRRAVVRVGAGVGTLALAVAASVVLIPRLGLWPRQDSVAHVEARLRDTSVLGAAQSSAAARVPASDSRALRVQGIHAARLSSGNDSQFARATGTTAMGAADGITLEAGVGLVAPPGGEIRIGTAQGTSLTIEAGSHLVVAENSVSTQRFTLRRGAVRVRVAKLHSGERFLIATADAEVEVHGTAFRVAMARSDRLCGAGTVTRVSVTEGVVSVRSRGSVVRLLPGDEWPTNCRAVRRASSTSARPLQRPVAVARRVDSTPSTPADLREAAAPAGAGKEGAIAAPKEALAASANPPARAIAQRLPPESVPASAAGHSRLGAQNDLFAAAVRAKGRGHTREAIRLFEDLARQYPDGPLAESALSQRMKLLRSTDPKAAAEAAAEYLAQFPGGFARGDARALLGPRPAP